MNILWIYDHPFKPESGGTERITKIIMDGLTKRGHNCMALLVFDQYNYGYLQYNDKIIPDLYRFLKDNEIDVVINQIAYAKWLLEDFYKLGGEKWRNEGGKVFSCLHFDPQFPPVSIKNLLIGWRNKSIFGKIKRLARISLTPWYNWKATRFYKYSYNYTYTNSDSYILLSNLHKPSFLKISGIINPKKLYAIFNPLTFPDISTSESLKLKENIILIVCRLNEEQKRVSFALKAWKKLQKIKKTKNWSLIIIGEGENEDYYKRLVIRWKLERVVFKGAQNPDIYYKKASVLLMTSSAEGWGLTLTESLQRGVIPVVMESSAVFREIIRDGKTGYIVPNKDIKKFTSRILEVMQNPNLRTTMAQCALKDAERFTISRALDLWEHLFNLTFHKYDNTICLDKSTRSGKWRN